MKEQFLEIRNYIDELDFYESSENFEYDHFPYIKNILENCTAKQHDDFVKELFTWSDYQKYLISRFLHETDFILQGKYDSSYVFCEYFAKISDVEFLEYLYKDLQLHLLQRNFFEKKLTLSIDDIINNLYLVMNHVRYQADIDYCLEIIENVNK